MAAGKYPSHTAILSSMGIAGVCQHVSQFSGYLPEPGAIRVMTPATWKVLVALQPCLRGGFTGSQWSSKSRVGTGTDECALGGYDQQRVLAKSWCINFTFCWAVAGRGLLLRCWWGHWLHQCSSGEKDWKWYLMSQSVVTEPIQPEDHLSIHTKPWILLVWYSLLAFW